VVAVAKQYSIAEAKDQLPRIVHEVEAGEPVELTRRGKPVAVVMSMYEYRLRAGKRPNFGEALKKFLETYNPVELGVTGEEFEGLRDKSPGREPPW
jgi:prevent-host-death family protein